MMRPIFLLLAFLMHSQFLLLTSCGSTATAPTPLPSTAPVQQAATTQPVLPASPTPTSVVTVTALPTATAQPATPPETTSILALAPFTLTLPAPWLTLQPRPDEWAQQVALVAELQPDLAATAQALLAMPTLTTTVLLAWSPAEIPGMTLIATVTPAEDLRLQAYLAAAEAALRQQPAATGVQVTVEEAAIRYDLHPEQWPLAIIRYTLQSSDPSVAPSSGYQVMTLDKTGMNLLLLTFTIDENAPEEADTLLDTIVATLQDNEG